MKTERIPQFKLNAFDCPNCLAFSNQIWHDVILRTYQVPPEVFEEFWFAKCNSCEDFSIWHDGKLVYPYEIIAPLPNSDMPDIVKSDFEEARRICNDSPRGAAALLRLAIEKLCKILGKENDDLNTNIGLLVANGLPLKIQKALDSIRVIGNKAVHPGQIDLKDDIKTVLSLFTFINIICENQITHMNLISEFYDEKVPESNKVAIEKRDKK
ncbi:DUF4145 domain-containing protein [Lacihabitans sp. CCS-44]|uniref:DUF4145 domain-containing protein n=1 Tax=Lacihabitans sp. CCS-44 TaxID=2487331 RepID=UPI0020CF2F24|nr:DUF4145 domain-containing protein [Lacihabitans sp. CCS-44]MCP9755702.1 DUF4145 domain-containing protein [Lacihabitans sp. CCS-44]